LSVLLRLRYLTHIEIIPSLGGVSPSRGQPCLSREVMRSLRNLRHLTLRESLASDPSAPIFFTSSFLLSLAGMTRSPLSRLSVDLTDFAPDPRTTQVFGAYLAGSNVKRLNIEWGEGGSGADAALLNQLPRELQVLRVNRIDTQGLELLAWRKRSNSLPALKELTILASEEDREVSLPLIGVMTCKLILKQLLRDASSAQRIRAALDGLRDTHVQVDIRS